MCSHIERKLREQEIRAECRKAANETAVVAIILLVWLGIWYAF